MSFCYLIVCLYLITLRKVRLILGSTSFDVFGTACSQKLLVLPAMIKNEPWYSGISNCGTSFRNLCRKRNIRVSPKVTDAMIGLLPDLSILSLCQETLSLPLRYRFKSTALNFRLVSVS